MTITIVDYGLGNIGSIRNMLNKIGHPNNIAKCKDDVLRAEKLILPGVGSFDQAMKNLKERDLIGALNCQVAEKGVPILGICLGMQLMTKSSAEGVLPGLGWIDGDVKRFDSESDGGIKVPQMGWNDVTIKKKSGLTALLDDAPRFYFVHSFFVDCTRSEDVLLETTTGSRTYHSGFCHNNIMGVQFHPEKSHRFGMSLLKGFVKS